LPGVIVPFDSLFLLIDIVQDEVYECGKKLEKGMIVVDIGAQLGYLR
jgi:hypothetical protein